MPSRLSSTDKVIIFVNLKRQGDTVGNYASQCGLTYGVIHGGKSQDQREEALEMFRNNDIQVSFLFLFLSLSLSYPFTFCRFLWLLMWRVVVWIFLT